MLLNDGLVSEEACGEIRKYSDYVLEQLAKSHRVCHTALRARSAFNIITSGMVRPYSGNGIGCRSSSSSSIYEGSYSHEV